MPSLWTPESWPERLAELEARSGDAKQAPLRRDIRSLGALLGQVQLQLDFQGPHLTFSGAMQRLPDNQVQWRDVSMRAELAALLPRVALPQGQPLGELQIVADQALLQGGWPLQMDGRAQWLHAAMRTRSGDVSLGDLQWQAQAQGGVIEVQLHDEGRGPLQADGQLQMSPLGWRLDAKLRARQTDPALRHWLAGLGQPDADGGVHIQRGGGLGGSLPMAARSINSSAVVVASVLILTAPVVVTSHHASVVRATERVMTRLLSSGR